MTEQGEFELGDLVRKHTGDYHVTGEIVAVITKRSGEVRYVVECDEPAGLLMIYHRNQLAPLTRGGGA